ncbi:B17.2 subunit of NADH:ubiquinone oxidoreductase [Scheffersomyces xylosifermentans]|uniref:B17.2 subunit of NADH:ubiquinone oxidoreductase n=1 Tax=Scheffersomyces xylosifermentans TaxID=1304137 RepID=UPI00315D0DA9
MSTSIVRTLKNIYKSGIKRAAWQIQTHNDTKSGWLVGEDDYGNKYYETDNIEEIHLRTRWVEYNDRWTQIDISKVEPGWHYWLGYGTNTIPPNLKGDEKTVRAYPLPEKHKPNLTNTTGAYVTYNTAKPKFVPWVPEVKERV